MISILVACGGSAPPAPVPTGGPPAATIAAPAGPADLVVASVGGRPVWGSCVAAQRMRGAKTRRAALDECVAFELLAQEAEARGLATDPEVIFETRRALVSRIVEREFEDRYRTPDDLRADLEKLLGGRQTMDVPEHRQTSHALVQVTEEAPADLVERARIVAERIHAELADETGLFHLHLDETAKRIGKAEGVEVVVEGLNWANRDARLVPEYKEAMFAIPEVGRVSPVLRSKFGFHVILLTDMQPARTLTRADVEPTMFTRARHQRFRAWTDELARGMQVEMYGDALEPRGDAP